MSVDVFGRHINKRRANPNVRTIGFKLTSDGQYNINGKRLCNVSPPERENDAVTVQFMLNKIDENQRVIDKKLNEFEQIFQKLRDQVEENEAYCDQLDERLSRFEQR